MNEMKDERGGWSWAFLGVPVLAVVCCGLPALLAAGLLAAAAGWLAAYGLWLGGGASLLVAVVIGWRWRMRRRQCQRGAVRRMSNG